MVNAGIIGMTVILKGIAFGINGAADDFRQSIRSGITGMPGVLQIEAMAQCGGLFILNTVDEPERYSTYFMKIDGVKFRQKVVPGDTLIFRVELLAPMRRGISSMKGYVFVGEKVVCEAEFTAQIVKNK